MNINYQFHFYNDEQQVMKYHHHQKLRLVNDEYENLSQPHYLFDE